MLANLKTPKTLLVDYAELSADRSDRCRPGLRVKIMQDHLVEIAKFRSPTEASLALGELEEAGISACLTNEASAGFLTHLGTADVGVGVLVADSDMVKAVQLLKGRPPKNAPEVADAPQEKLVRAWRASILGIFFFPLSIYSLYLLVRHRLLAADAAVRQSQAVTALVLTITGLIIGVFYVVGWVFFLVSDLY